MREEKTVIVVDGRHQFGRYTQPFTLANISDAHLDDYSPWLQRPTPWNAWARRLRLKEWHFVSIDHSDIFLAFAVAQLGYVANLFAYAFDKKTREVQEWGERIPFGLGLRFGASSIQGKTVWQSRRHQLEVINRPEGWDISLQLGTLRGQFTITRDEAMALVFPLGPNRGAYTHKEAGNEVRGQLHWNGKDLTLTPDQTLGVSDWSRSFSNRVTEWYWSSLAARDVEGARIGLNLSARIYDDRLGISQENAVWVNGRCHSLGAARFHLPATQDIATKAWQVRTTDGGGLDPSSVDLHFEPLGVRREHVTVGLIASQFTQVFGHYSGTLHIAGRTHRLDKAFGVAENHYSKW